MKRRQHVTHVCGPDETLSLPDPECPNAANHTPSPAGYLGWFEWAERMNKTHRSTMCGGCKRYLIWVPRKSRAAKRKEG